MRRMSEKKNDDNDINDGNEEEVITLCFDLNFEEKKTTNNSCMCMCVYKR